MTESTWRVVLAAASAVIGYCLGGLRELRERRLLDEWRASSDRCFAGWKDSIAANRRLLDRWRECVDRCEG